MSEDFVVDPVEDDGPGWVDPDPLLEDDTLLPGIPDDDTEVLEGEVVGEVLPDDEVVPVDSSESGPTPLGDGLIPDPVEDTAELVGAQPEVEDLITDGTEFGGGGDDFALDSDEDEAALEASLEATDDFVDDPETNPHEPVFDEDTLLVLDPDGVEDVESSPVDPEGLWDEYEVEGCRPTQAESALKEYIPPVEGVEDVRVWEPFGRMGREGEGEFEGLEPGTEWLIRVRGVNADGYSDWSPPAFLEVPVDTIPPPAPKAPLVVPVHGGFNVSWEGVNADGSPLPKDFGFAELRSGTGEGTVITKFGAGWAGFLPELALVPRTFWVTTVDAWGNRSVPSATVTETALALVDDQSIRDALDEAQQAIDNASAAAQSELSVLDGRLSTAEQDLVDAGGRLDATQQAIDVVQQAIDSVSSQTQGELSALDGRLSTAEGDLSDAAGRLSSVEAGLGDAQQALDVVSSETQSELAVLGGRLSTAEGDLDAAESRLDDTEASLSTVFPRLDTVESDVDGAASAAQSAQSTADNALTMAGSKSKVYYSTSTPSGTASDGDVWRRVDAAKDVIGEWYWAGGWQKSQITTQQISNLDVGKLTVGTGVISDLVAQHIAAQSAQFLEVDVEQLRVTGTGTMTEAVLQKLWADGIAARTASLANLAVASQNIIPNGDLTQGDRFWSLGNAQIVTDDTPPGYEYAIRRAPNDGAVRHDERFPVQGGQEYLFEMWIKADKPGSVFFWDMRDQNGTHVGQTEGGGHSEAVEPETGHDPNWRPVGDYLVPTEWSRIRTIVRPGPGVTSLGMSSSYFNHGNGDVRDATVSIGGIRLSSRLDGSMIVENSITAPKIVASEELTAKVAQFLELNVEELRVAGTGTINEAVVQKLWADGIRANSASLARATIAAPNLIPGWPIVNNQRPEGFEAFGLNSGHPSVWLKGRQTVRTSVPFRLYAGEKYRFSVEAQASVPGTWFYWGLVDNETSNEVPGYLISAGKPGTDWITFEGEKDITESKDYRLIVFANHPSGASNDDGYQWFRNMRLVNMTDGSLIADNSITAPKITASEELSAKVAQFLEVDAEQLRVTGTGTIDEAVVQKLWADGIAARSATLGRAIIAAPNLVSPPGESPDAWQVDPPWALVTNAYSADGMAFRATPDDTQARVIGPRFPVTPGETLKFDFDYGRLGNSRSDGGSFLVGMLGYTQQEGGGTASFGPYIPGDQGSGTRWENFAGWDTHGTGTVVVPDGVTWAAPTLYIYPATGTPVANAHSTIYNFRVTKMVDGTLIADNSITAPKVTASQELSAKVAQFLNVKANHLDANEIWSNTAWLGQAKFSSVAGNRETLIDSSGLTLYQSSEGSGHSRVPLVQVTNDSGNAFIVNNPTTGAMLGGINSDGVVSGSAISCSGDIIVGGQDLLGDMMNADIPSRGDGYGILDHLPRGIVASGMVSHVVGNTYNNPTHLGFMELSFDTIWNRSYRLHIRPYRVTGVQFQKVVITYDGSTPKISDSGTVTRIEGGGAGTGGSYLINPVTGVCRVLVGVYGATPGITFPSGQTMWMWVEDVGTRVESSIQQRSSQIIPSQPETDTSSPVKKSYHSAWRPNWMRSYYNGGSSIQATGMGSTMIKQGRDMYWSAGGIQTGSWGGYRSTNAVAGETGKSMSAALSGASVDGATLEIKADYVPGGGTATVRLHWHNLSSAGSTLTITSNHIGDYTIAAGSSRRITLPSSVRTAISNGTLRGFYITPRGSTSQNYAMGVSWSTKPTLRVNYTR